MSYHSITYIYHVISNHIVSHISYHGSFAIVILCIVPYHWKSRNRLNRIHYDDVIMTMLASQITSLTVVYSIVYSGVNQRKHQSSASLAFVREIHRGPVNFPHKWPVTRKMFPFDDVIMVTGKNDRQKFISYISYPILSYHVISYRI